MKRIRKMHLWVGLITSVIILLESITGLMLEEPQWFGGTNVNTKGELNPGQFQRGFQQRNSVQSQNGANSSHQQSKNQFTGQAGGSQWQAKIAGGQFPRREGMLGSFRDTVEQLHRGVFNGVDIHWLMDLAAIGMIFLSGSGIFMSIKILSAQRKRRKDK